MSDHLDGPEHLDVVVVGAGLAGIAAAHHLTRACPGLSYAVLEARSRVGGTWDLFSYPGLRSDSDVFTLGFSFAPWRGPDAIADGASIRTYVEDTARSRGLHDHIRFHHTVRQASWSTSSARWHLRVDRTGPAGEVEPVSLTCSFLVLCTGYFRYDRGHVPDLPGAADFEGDLVHPQHWPSGLETAGKRVVVVGSGATAVTLVPALADSAEHVTMLQRTPTYVVSAPRRDRIGDALRRSLPARAAHHVVRAKNIAVSTGTYWAARTAPRLTARWIQADARRRLPAGFDVERHFTPPYRPWDQRLCLAPDGDFFSAIAGGRVSVVTDHIERITPDGVRLASGECLAADVVVLATGLELRAFGDITLEVDGRRVRDEETVTVKGCLLAGVPNAAFAFGYTNAAWTLKCELTAAYLGRLIRHMRTHGYRIATPSGPPPGQEPRPMIDLQAGYVRRSRSRFPQQGTTAPWRMHQNYLRDLWLLRGRPLVDHVDLR